MVGLAVMVGVDVAINFDAVLEVAPLVDAIVAVGIDEIAQHPAFGVADDPAGVAVDLLGGDRALGHLVGSRLIEFDILLQWLDAHAWAAVG